MSEPSKEEVIAHYHMQAHPEGGYYVETFRSAMTVQTPLGERSASTSILFLLGQQEASNLHRIKSEEIFHHYAGGPLAIVELVEETRSYKVTMLGKDIHRGQVLQHVLKPNVWFGAYLDSPDATYGLVGCTVAPGFDFQDFELADRSTLLAEYPSIPEIITKLTPEGEAGIIGGK